MPWEAPYDERDVVLLLSGSGEAVELGDERVPQRDRAHFVLARALVCVLERLQDRRAEALVAPEVALRAASIADAIGVPKEDVAGGNPTLGRFEREKVLVAEERSAHGQRTQLIASLGLVDPIGEVVSTIGEFQGSRVQVKQR